MVENLSADVSNLAQQWAAFDAEHKLPSKVDGLMALLEDFVDNLPVDIVAYAEPVHAADNHRLDLAYHHDGITHI